MSTFRFAKNNVLLTDVVPSMPQLLNSKPVQTRTSAPAVSPPYPETAYQWLAEVLDGLIDFRQRHGHYGVIKLTKDEYQWLDDVLEKLICSVGEDENHRLGPLMDFIIRLIANYEQTYVPKLTERFPELAGETPIDTAIEKEQFVANTPKLSDIELAAHAFFSIGCLLWEGGKAEKALSAYDTAIRIKPDYAEVYNNRGVQRVLCEKFDAAIVDFTEAIRIKPDYVEAYVNRGIAKTGLGRIDEAQSDLYTASELAEQQRNNNLKDFVEKWLRQLNQVASKQNNKKPRRGGQWKGKVKIAEDFNELPESFMTVFSGEDE